jgi:hypothetical protein
VNTHTWQEVALRISQTLLVWNLKGITMTPLASRPLLSVRLYVSPRSLTTLSPFHLVVLLSILVETYFEIEGVAKD